MHPEGKLLREEMLRYTFVLQSCDPGGLQLKFCVCQICKFSWFVDANWMVLSQPAEGEHIQRKRVLSPFSEGLMPPFTLLPSWSFWELVSGSGQGQYLWAPEYWVHSFVRQCSPRTSSRLSWFVRYFGVFSTCSAQWPERGPGLACYDLKNSNLKNIVKK